MAGTRLTLVVVYSIQIIALFALSFYQSIQTSYSKNNKWSRIHQPFTVDRQGISYLKSKFYRSITGNYNGNDNDSNVENDEIGVLSLLDQMKNMEYHILDEVRFNIIYHCRFNSHIGKTEKIKKEEESRILRDSLQLGFDQYLYSKINPHDDDNNDNADDVEVFPSVNVNASVKEIILNEDEDRSLYCEEDDITLLRLPTFDDDLQHGDDSNRSFIYDIHILKDCHREDDPDDKDNLEMKRRSRIPKIQMNELGTMIIRFAHQTTLEEMEYSLRHPIARFLTSWMNNSSGSSSKLIPTNLLSSSSLNVVSTLIDSDPSSYASSTMTEFGPIDHYKLLSATFQEQMNQSISNMIEHQLSPPLSSSSITTPRRATLFKSSKLTSHGMTYVGHDMVSKAVYKEYENDTPNDYTILLNDAKKIIWNGEIGNAIGLFDGSNNIIPNINGDQKGEAEALVADEVVWNLVFFVPPSTSTPLFIGTENDVGNLAWSRAFAIPSKNTIVSIVNIDHDRNGSDSNSGPNSDSREVAYQNAIREAISFTASYIREQFGLSPVPHNALGTQSYTGIDSDETDDIDDEKIFIEYHYSSRSSFGIAAWEVDALLRQSWSMKVEKVILLIERIMNLVQMRTMIGFPIEVAQRLEQCVHHLKEATNRNDDKSLQERTNMLNLALEEAVNLTVDEEILELPFVSYDQLFAIFGSLILPLLAPMLKNFAYEAKRYRILSKKI